MQCKDYQKLLHLNRSGELTKSQSKMLAEHLALCKSCFEKEHAINKADVALARLRNIKPVLSEPAKLTNQIMGKIKASTQKQKSRLTKIAESLLEFITLYQIRFALSLVTVFLVGTLLTQQIFILNQVTKLENKMASGRPSSNKYYTIKSSELASIWNPTEIRALVGVLFQGESNLSNDLISLKRSRVKSWTKKLNKKEKKILTKLFGKNFLKEESVQKALDKVFSKKSDIIGLHQKRYPNWRK